MNGTGNNEDISAETVPDWTYFIQQGSGEIKIGRSVQPRARMRTLQSENGAKLTFLMAVPFSRITESAAHRKFSHLRLHGEWFRPEQDLLDFIGVLKAEAKKPIRPTRRLPKKPEAIGALQVLRRKHGAESAIGYHCSNLAEQIDEMRGYVRPAWATHKFQTLPWMMEQQIRRIEDLTK